MLQTPQVSGKVKGCSHLGGGLLEASIVLAVAIGIHQLIGSAAQLLRDQCLLLLLIALILLLLLLLLLCEILLLLCLCLLLLLLCLLLLLLLLLWCQVAAAELLPKLTCVLSW